MDKLATIVNVHSTDMICIVKSSLSNDVPNNEISLIGYHSCRFHSDGVLILLASLNLTMTLNYIIPQQDCALLHSITLQALLDDVAGSINSTQFKNSIRIGDFENIISFAFYL